MIESGHEFIHSHFYTPTEIDHKGGLWLLKAGKNIAKPNYHVGPQITERYSLHFVLEGKVIYRFKGKNIKVGKGDIFALYPGINHEYKTLCNDPKSPLKMYWLDFAGPQALDFLQMAGIYSTSPYLKGRLNCHIREQINQIIQLLGLRNMTEKDYFLMQSLFYKVLFQIAEDRKKKSLNSQELVEKSIEFIHTHYRGNITVEEISNFVGLNRSYFSRIFSKHTGMSPKSYLQKKKMDAAIEFLQDENSTVTEVALSLGYHDLYSFTKAFTNYYGKSPSNYIKIKSKLPS